MKPTFLLLLVFIPAFGQGQMDASLGELMISLTGETQGTTYHIKYCDERQSPFQRQIDSLLADIDKSLSIYRPDSEISQFNRSMSHRFQLPHFYAVLKKSAEVFRDTKGAFDPTVLPLVEAYGFGPTKKPKGMLVNADSLLQYVGFQNIVFDSISVVKQKANIRLDLNSIAQGYSVDVVAGFLEAQDIKQYMVEIGGEVRTKGRKNDGQPWTIGIENPLHPNQLQTKINLHDRAMTTAGNYRNRYEVNGQVFSHIINPKTGEMEQSSILSVTVFAEDAITADGYDTAFFVMGIDAVKQFLVTRKDIDVYILYTDDAGRLKIFSTDGLKNL
ncbi:FAD:protein FMN transferase [Runella sp.]|uniref:FAD:protein FMN transferase n=1 Tax=Runella sp. TaxID=1960881 RepID=UPI003D151199